MSAFPRRALHVATANLMCVSAISAAAANLVTNPDFDAGFTGWTPTAGAPPTLDDTDGSPSVPSAHMVSVGINSQLTSDCIAAGTSQYFDFFVNVKVHAGSADVFAASFSDADCTTPAGIFGFVSSVGIPLDTWTQLSTGPIGIPVGAGAVSIRLGLGVTGSFFGSQSDASFDHVRFGPTGTVPVRLQSFNVD